MGGRLIGSLLLMVSCGKPSDGSDSETSTGTVAQDDGEDGGWFCTLDSECVLPSVDSIEQPAATPSPYDVYDCIEGMLCGETFPLCRCFDDVDGRGGDIGFPNADCLVWGRARDCLYRSDEFPGCTIGDAGSCEAVCDDVYAREVADAEATHTAVARGTRCNSGECDAIIVIDGRCYVANDLEPFDCSLSDAEMFAAYDERRAMQTDTCG